MTRERRFDSFAGVGDAFEDADARIGRVKRCELPSHVEVLVDAYDQTVGIRDRFLWQWLYFVFPAMTLSCVDPASVDVDSFLSSMEKLLSYHLTTRATRGLK